MERVLSLFFTAKAGTSKSKEGTRNANRSRRKAQVKSKNPKAIVHKLMKLTLAQNALSEARALFDILPYLEQAGAGQAWWGRKKAIRGRRKVEQSALPHPNPLCAGEVSWWRQCLVYNNEPFKRRSHELFWTLGRVPVLNEEVWSVSAAKPQARLVFERIQNTGLFSWIEGLKW